MRKSKTPASGAKDGPNGHFCSGPCVGAKANTLPQNVCMPGWAGQNKSPSDTGRAGKLSALQRDGPHGAAFLSGDGLHLVSIGDRAVCRVGDGLLHVKNLGAKGGALGAADA